MKNDACASSMGVISEDDSAFREHVLKQFRGWIQEAGFPCVGAKAAFNSDAYALEVYDELGSAASTTALAASLLRFTQSEVRAKSEYATCIAIFRHPGATTEQAFEELLWRQLLLLRAADAQPWDPSVESDPADRHFSFSFAGQALYVIGLHANSSRQARRFPWTTLVFNPHEQFERLRADGKWKRMQQTIRERDLELQGSINPMLSDFGESSEARQYSGRAVEEGWKPPGTIGKCPFGH